MTEILVWQISPPSLAFCVLPTWKTSISPMKDQQFERDSLLIFHSWFNVQCRQLTFPIKGEGKHTVAFDFQRLNSIRTKDRCCTVWPRSKNVAGSVLTANWKKLIIHPHLIKCPGAKSGSTGVRVVVHDTMCNQGEKQVSLPSWQVMFLAMYLPLLRNAQWCHEHLKTGIIQSHSGLVPTRSFCSIKTVKLNNTSLNIH